MFPYTLSCQNRDAEQLHEMLAAWNEQTGKLRSGEISKEDYDRWRYNYPDYDTSALWHKVTPSQALSDMLTDELK